MNIEKEPIGITQVENGYCVYTKETLNSTKVFQSKKELFKYLNKYFDFENETEIDNDKNKYDKL